MAAQSVQPLQDSLEALEKTLEPLFEKELHESLDEMDHLEQAKLCATLPYVIDQLLLSFLRAKGIKEEDQEFVHSELNRAKEYFRKIPWASGSNTEGRVSEQNLRVDKEAANRFITAALAGLSNSEKEEQSNLGIDGPTQSSHFNWKPRERGPDEQTPQLEGGVHTRFAHISSVLEESDSQDSSVDENTPVRVAPPGETDNKKRKRPPMDPFSGYDMPKGKPKKLKGKKQDNTNSVISPEPDLVVKSLYMDVDNGASGVKENDVETEGPTVGKSSKKKAKNHGKPK